MTPRPEDRVLRIAVAGGKGGVGKSLLAANLSVYLAQIGRRVALVDGDARAFALGSFLGLDEPAARVSATDVAGLAVVTTAGLDDPADVAALCDPLDCDVAIFDLPPWPPERTRALWLLAEARVLAVTPEPGAIEGAVRFVRAALSGGDAGAARPLLVVNHTRGKADLELGSNLRTTWLRVLGVRLDLLGTIEADEAVWLSARKRRPLVGDYPDARASRDVERIARRLLSLESEPARALAPPRLLDAAGCYDLLEVERGSSDEEIRRAYRRLREVWAPGSLALSGLLGRAEAAGVVRRIEDAYETLIDPERRRQYDLESFADGHAAPPPLPARPIAPPGPAPGEPAVDARTEFSGDLLRRIREARGMDLGEIARRTKVGARYLRAIEDERWKDLPQRVYLRGFLIEYARTLRLPVAQVVRTVLARMEGEAEEEA